MGQRNRKIVGAIVLLSLLGMALACVLSPVSWSPDGRWIALVRYLTQKKTGGEGEDVIGNELWIVSQSPIERRRLLTTRGTLSGATWSNDSKSLYVVGFEEGTATLWRVALDGERKRVAPPQQCGDNAGDAVFSSPAISPDGRRIAFLPNDSNVAIARGDGRLERTIEMDDPRTLLWSPDGRWLAVAGDGEGKKPSVRFCDTQTSEIYTLDIRYRAMCWLPDGKRYVATRSPSDGSSEGVSICVLEGMANPRVISSFEIDREPGGPLVLSPKGDAVFFTCGEDDERKPAIYRLDLRSGQSQLLHESPGAVCAWATSPDGRSLVFRESAIGDDPGADSILGVLNLTATTEPLYLAMHEKQWAGVIEVYAKELRETASSQVGPKEEKTVPPAFRQMERFVAAMRRDFPKSRLLPEATKQLEEIRAALKQAGISLGTGRETTQWSPP